jgi:hypothetical protein
MTFTPKTSLASTLHASADRCCQTLKKIRFHPLWRCFDCHGVSQKRQIDHAEVVSWINGVAVVVKPAA